jgi:glycosyltransferase involved in cell wall biosynthesis
MQNHPLVSIAMPVCNAEKTLALAIRSIMQQTYKNWELLLIDDGSVDQSIELIRDFHDRRIKITRDGQNLGLATRLNQAVDIAQGEYIARMDADDVAYPERLQRQVDILQSNRGLDLVAVRTLAITAEDEPVGIMPFFETHVELSAQPWKGFYLAHPTWMARTAWFKKHKYRLPAPYCCEDQELLLRSYKSSCFYTLPETLSAYRLRSKIASRKALRTRLSMLAFQSRYFIRNKQYRCMALSLGAFVARVILDTSSIILGSRLFLKMKYTAPLTLEEKRKWQVVLQSLAD